MEIDVLLDLARDGHRFRVDGYPGVAFRLAGVEHDHTDYGDQVETGFLIMIMIGDDRKFYVEPCEISPIDDLDYCHECGQIGCTADGR